MMLTHTLREVVICEPMRTPVGRFAGSLSGFQAQELAATVIRSLMIRTGIPPDSIDDVIVGNCYPTMESPAIGRVAALDAGLPISVPGLQLDRRCGSGLQAVIDATMRVQLGAADLVLAGGAESMSNAAFYSLGIRHGVSGDVPLHDALARGRVTAGGRNYPVPGGMIETAENLRREFKLSRAEQDEYALRSHERALRAQQLGLFDDEIVSVPNRVSGQTLNISLDEQPRADTTIEQLGRLRAIMSGSDPDATVTAGNSSGQNDGAAFCIVTHIDNAREFKLRPLGKLTAWAVSGVEPSRMGVGPIPAVALALERADLNLSDMGLIELNEAFAAQVLACTRQWNFADSDFDRLNVNGSGISLGHPVGATGCRILATMLREMARRGTRYGLETMCIGGGQGLAAIFESVE